MENKKHHSEGRSVYIVDGLRTPFLKFKGVPGDFSASDLAVSAGRALLARQPFSPERFDQVIVGCANPSEEEANIARIIALRLGCGIQVPAYTVQRNCASGLQALDSAMQSIASGHADLVLAGGTDALSRAPLLVSRSMATWLGYFQKARTLQKKLKTLASFRLNYLVPVVALLKGFTDPIVNLNMGQTAEELAFRFNITRSEMDAYSIESHLRMVRALERGEISEINPLYSYKGDFYDFDDGVRADSTIERLAKLKPAFEKFGSITPGNSSQITDGAAMLILASEEAVKTHKLPVIGKIIDTAWAALDPAIMGLGPIHAMTPLLQRNNLRLDDIDVVEINEAFSAQVLACVKAWNDEAYCKKELGLKHKLGLLPMDKLNPDGGAVAVGHPVGASGARIVLHALKYLHVHKKQRALASLCIGGGQGGAILLERATEV